MKILSKILTAILASSVLFFTACVCGTPKPVLLSQMDVDMQVEPLYQKLCASGVLDEIAEEWGDEGKKPLLEIDDTKTNRLDTRNHASGVNYSSLSRGIANKILPTRIFRFKRGETSAVGNVKSKNKTGNTVIIDPNKEKSRLDDRDEDPDYLIKSSISSTPRRVGSQVSYYYTFSVDLLCGSETIWTGETSLTLPRD